MKAKNISLAIFAVLCFAGSALNAQSLWAPAFYGGATNGGTLVKMNPDGTGLTKFYDFSEGTGSSPMGSVLQATDGKIYGTCLNGGDDSSCVIYCYDTTTSTYKNLWSFDVTNGDFPMSGLIQGPNSMLYGTASAGGFLTQGGTIYSFNTLTNTYKGMYWLTGTSQHPCGSPVLATNGKLYGLTSGYGFYSMDGNGFGSIYSYDIDSNIYTDLHVFDGIHDGYAFGSLIEHNGIFYGMTSGSRNYAPALMQGIFPGLRAYADPVTNPGNIFSYNPATNTYTDLHNFDSINGANPYGTLFRSANGKLYGMTSAGGTYNKGVIFSLDATNNSYTKLFDFDGTNGDTPMGDLIQSTDGSLYGTTSFGGAYNKGVVFSFNPVSHVFTVLNSFDGTNGSAPLGGTFAFVNTGTATGIVSPMISRSISVYPVPAHDNITVSVELPQGENPVFTLTDINGRIVWGPQPQPVTGNSNIQLNLSFLESGVYFLQAKTGDNVMTKKIVRE